MVSGLREWASATGLLETSPFTQLEHRRIAIAAENYINGLLTGPQTREPLLPALGGLPFTLDKLLRDQLQVFKECNITPIFIFDGLRNNAQQTQLRSAAAYAKTVGGAWDLYNASDPERAVSEFGTCSTYNIDKSSLVTDGLLSSLWRKPHISSCPEFLPREQCSFSCGAI